MIHTISIVDDDEINAKLLAFFLRNEGFNIMLSCNGKDALEKYQQAVPDVILLDIDMPEMNGFELIRAVKENIDLKDIPVIFISAHDDLESKVYGLQLGGIDFISKPFQNIEVVTRVRIHLKNSLLNKQLKELNDKKNKFFSLIAKDMRGNIAEIIQKVELLEDYIEMNDIKSLKDSLFSLDKFSKKTMRFLRNLLEWSSMQINTYRFNPKFIGIKRIIKEILKDYDIKIKTKGIQIVNMFEESDIQVIADEYSLRIILDNLLSNAVKFTNEGAFIKFDYTLKNDVIMIHIINKGIFFPKTKLEKIFKIEHEVNQVSPYDEEKGSGLGLLLCKELIEKNGGDITINANGNITTVSFSLCVHLN